MGFLTKKHFRIKNMNKTTINKKNYSIVIHKDTLTLHSLGAVLNFRKSGSNIINVRIGNDFEWGFESGAFFEAIEQLKEIKGI